MLFKNNHIGFNIRLEAEYELVEAEALGTVSKWYSGRYKVIENRSGYFTSSSFESMKEALIHVKALQQLKDELFDF